MPMKTLFYRFQPAPLCIVLILSICYFSVQLILSHLTHALTLLMASYHMLCNIFALAGSIITIKHNELHNKQEHSVLPTEDKQRNVLSVTYPDDPNTPKYPPINSREFKTRNTFGWARIEILTMLIVCITLASLSFSLLVEALQTLVHIDHQDSMHLPFHVMILGFVGLLLNGFAYFVIGGYTLHQGNFLHINPTDGKVIVKASNITIDNESKNLAVQDNIVNEQHLKEAITSELGKVHYHTRREGPAEFLRDISSTIFVIVCAIIVYFAKDKEHTAKFIDPVLSIFSCVLLVALSYPYMKEACFILLQTIPGNIDMDNFETALVKKFPQIVSYHDLHIWQLSSHKYIATVHIIFQNPKIYAKTIDEVRQHFHDHSIANVTIQPEFYDETTAKTASVECLMQCTKPECLDKVCCKDSMTDLREVSVCPDSNNDEHLQANDHAKRSCGKIKKHNDHHGHSNGHSHDQSHSHKHDKHTNKHNKNDQKYNPEVPNEKITSEIARKNEIQTRTEEASTNIQTCVDNDTSHMPAALKDCKTSKIDKLLEKTEASDLSQTKDSQMSQVLGSNISDKVSTLDNKKC